MVFVSSADATRPIPCFHGETSRLAEVDTQALRARIEDFGAVLLRDFTFSLDDFGTLAEGLCSSSVFNESPNRRLLHQRNGVQSVDLGGDPFPLHPELAREPWRPDLCMFGCITPPSVGGQTNLCDGIALVEALPHSLIEALQERRLIYIQAARPQVVEYWLETSDPSDEQLANPPADCPYRFRRATGRRQGQILRIFTRPVFESTTFQNKPAFANFLLFARDYLGKPTIPLLDDGKPFPEDWLDTIRSAARSITYAHRWQPGDVLLVDNSRFMHGRRAIADEGERQIATYFGYLQGVGPLPGEGPDPVWRREPLRAPGPARTGLICAPLLLKAPLRNWLRTPGEAAATYLSKADAVRFRD